METAPPYTFDGGKGGKQDTALNGGIGWIALRIAQPWLCAEPLGDTLTGRNVRCFCVGSFAWMCNQHDLQKLSVLKRWYC